MLTLEDLKSRFDFAANDQSVQQHLADATASLPRLIRFLSHYASWNSVFGSSVATLSGTIAREQTLFIDRSEPWPTHNDRSVFVASYFFDAAKDEFDNRGTPARSTHRCLAQALVKGLVRYARERRNILMDDKEVAALLHEPRWLARLKQDVVVGYGASIPGDRHCLFRAMGFHLGSELLADQEFSLFDAALEERAPELVDFLKTEKVTMTGETFNPYAWLAIHSGHGAGDAVEADHFDFALHGANFALQFSPTDLQPELTDELYEGFTRFAENHHRFFTGSQTDKTAI